METDSVLCMVEKSAVPYQRAWNPKTQTKHLNIWLIFILGFIVNLWQWLIIIIGLYLLIHLRLLCFSLFLTSLSSFSIQSARFREREHENVCLLPCLSSNHLRLVIPFNLCHSKLVFGVKASFPRKRHQAERVLIAGLMWGCCQEAAGAGWERKLLRGRRRTSPRASPSSSSPLALLPAAYLKLPQGGTAVPWHKQPKRWEGSKGRAVRALRAASHLQRGVRQRAAGRELFLSVPLLHTRSLPRAETTPEYSRENLHGDADSSTCPRLGVLQSTH